MNYSRVGNPRDVKNILPRNNIPNPDIFSTTRLIDPNAGKAIDQIAFETLGGESSWRLIASKNADRILSWKLSMEHVPSLAIPNPVEYKYK
jgi:hypothetical protein